MNIASYFSSFTSRCKNLDIFKISGSWNSNAKTYPFMNYEKFDMKQSEPEFSLWGVPPFVVIVKKRDQIDIHSSKN